MRRRSLLMALALSACATHQADRGDDLWALTSLSGSDVLANATPTLGLRNGQVFGSTGCNGFLGHYVQMGDQITISELEMTLIACGRADIHSQESRYYNALAGTARMSRSLETMMLTYENGETLTFVRRDARQTR